MRILLDTHVLIWWLLDSDRLRALDRKLIKSPDNHIYVSAATVWEIAIKYNGGKLELNELWYETICDEPFAPLDINHEHAQCAGQLPPHHGDPLDRLLVAQAMLEDMVLLTHDKMIHLYDVAIAR